MVPRPGTITRASPSSGRWGVLEPVFASKIASSAGLRNRIVHEYDDIDPAKVFEAIQLALADLPVYLKGVLSFTG
ncbi:MAG: DUF86 domain-containing protein [Deltaproteobacteria bacterium]|nr:DUF86 domain-containing protein [Deltaproteobacteria bacterium]